MNITKDKKRIIIPGVGTAVGICISSLLPMPILASSGSALGLETTCIALPGWIWYLELGIFITLVALNDYVNMQKKEYHWKTDAVLVGLVVLFWVLFDRCRIYAWFLNAAIASAAIIHMVYALDIKNHTKNNHS